MSNEDKTIDMSNMIVYIDGFNLYHGMKSKYKRKFYWLDIQKLSESFIRNDQILSKVKYFTAMIGNNPHKEFRQKTYISALKTLSKVELFYGKYQVNDHICPHCGNVEHIPSEKMTDVNIATQLLSDAFSNNFDVAILVSADSDLYGPINMVRKNFPEKSVVIAFPPDRVSFELKNIASAFFYITRRSLEKSLFPDRIIINKGYVLSRPFSWK